MYKGNIQRFAGTYFDCNNGDGDLDHTNIGHPSHLMPSKDGKSIFFWMEIITVAGESEEYVYKKNILKQYIRLQKINV